MLPFTLRCRDDGNWGTRWAEERLHIVVGGSADAPDLPSIASLTEIVERWPEVCERVATHLASLDEDDHVPLEPGRLGGFAVRNCGFDQELWFESISVPDPALPDHVEITFSTGYPDNYATYRIVLIAGQPDVLTAYAS